MQAFGYLVMALFGLHFFFVGYRAYQREVMLRKLRDESNGLLGLLGQVAKINPINMRLAAAFFALVALGINVLLGYAFGVTLEGALIAEAVGAGVGLGIYLIVVRPVQKRQEAFFEQINATFEEILQKAPSNGASGNGAAEEETVVVTPIDCDALLGPNRPVRGDEDKPEARIEGPEICIYPPRPGLEPKPEDAKDEDKPAGGDDSQPAQG